MIQLGIDRIRQISRTTYRGLKVALVLAAGAIELHALRREKQGAFHRLCKRLVAALEINLTTIGPVPKSGLIVSNHLGYLDIVVLGAITPIAFVAKAEVKSWPIFGRFARHANTIFVERNRVAATERSVGEIRSALGSNRTIVLFPEGTSSGGATVLPFKSSLLEAAANEPVTPAAVAYALVYGDGDPSEDVCYWKDHTLASHLVRLLGKRKIAVAIAFDSKTVTSADRKRLAGLLHDRVVELKKIAAEELSTTRILKPTNSLRGRNSVQSSSLSHP
jgi:1-acyl-sn-glycerol-3-phosphate acyltransferase